MTTEILSSEPQVPHHSQKLSPATQTKLAGVISQITGVLSPEGKNEIKEKNERMQQLLIQLKEAIQKKSEEIGYDYEPDNYEIRLSLSDEAKEQIFQKILSGQESSIRKIYKEMMNIIPEKGKRAMKEKLKREYFEDLIYESMKNEEGEEGKSLDLSHSDLGKKTGKELRDIIRGLSVGLKSLNLGSNDLGDNTGDLLVEMMRKLPVGLKKLNLGRNELYKKSGEELKEIMRSLPVGLKSLNLVYNLLGEKNGEELREIMKSLPVGLKSLGLGKNDLGEKSVEELREIMKSLPVGLKSLGLGKNDLGEKSVEELREIMKSLPVGLKSVDLGYNDIPEEIQEKLQKEFPNIQILF